MKKIFLSIALSIFLFSGSAFADWSTHRYFQCKVTKKFTARAKLKPPGQLFYTQTYDGGCGYAEADLSSLAVNNTPNCGYAWAKANGSNANQRSGWAQCGWSWGENVDLVPAFFSFAPMFSKGEQKFENEANYTGAELNDDGINFNENTRTISIQNLNGFLRIISDDLLNSYTTFQINVYTFEMDGEEAIPVQTLWHAKASIINGALILEDNFQSSDFTDNSSGGTIEYGINAINKSVSISASIDIEEVCVEISGDGGNSGMGIPNNYTPTLSSEEIDKIKSNVKFDFNLIVNNEIVKANITTNTSLKVINELSIVSLTGVVIKSKKILGKDDELSLGISDLPNGVYLLMIKSDDEYYSKKFFK